MVSSTSHGSVPLQESLGAGMSATSRRRSGNTRGPAIPLSKRLKPGEKIVLRLTEDTLQPCSPKKGVHHLSSEIATLVKREIPIYYKSFPDMIIGCAENDIFPYKTIIDSLNNMFQFEGDDDDEGVACDYVRDKITAAWRSRKYDLKKTYLDGKDPEEVRTMEAPEDIPLEDWRAFVELCNSDDFKAKSAKNKINRAKQTEPNCSGRTPAQLVRHEIAKERGVPDVEIFRGDLYLGMHSHGKNKIPQRQDLVDKIGEHSASNPQSDPTCDAVAEVLGKDGRGRMRLMGSGCSKSKLKNSSPYVKRNQKQVKATSDLAALFENKLDQVTNKFQGQVDKLTQTVQILSRMIPITPSTPNGPSSSSGFSSRNTVSNESNYIDVEVDVRAHWPLRKVASGRVINVDPGHKIGRRTVGDGNFLVCIEAIIESSCEIPEPYNHFRTLGQIGQGNVIWPKAFLNFLPPRC